MTRVKSFGQGIKGFANPYEPPKQTKKSARHRTHRSKKNRKYIRGHAFIQDYKKRLEEQKLKDLET